MFFRHTQKPKFRLVLDADSHALSALIFEVPTEDDKPPKVVKKMEVQLRFASGGVRTVGKIHSLLFTALKVLDEAPEHVIIGLGPSVAKCALEVWQKEYHNNGITQSLDDMHREFQALFVDHKEKDQLLIGEPLEAMANGYAFLPGYGQGAPLTELKFHVFTVSCTGEVQSALEKIKEALGGIPLTFAPVPVALAEGILASKKIDSGLIVEINDAETSLILFREKKLIGFSSFPFGTANFIRRLGESRGFMREEARDMIRQTSFEISGVAEWKKNHDLLYSVIEAWKQSFIKALASFYTLGPLSENIFLVGEGAHILPLRAYLGSTEWLEGMSYGTTPKLHVLDSSAFFEGSSMEGALQGPKDARLAALVRYSLFHISLFQRLKQ